MSSYEDGDGSDAGLDGSGDVALSDRERRRNKSRSSSTDSAAGPPSPPYTSPAAQADFAASSRSFRPKPRDADPDSIVSSAANAALYSPSTRGSIMGREPNQIPDNIDVAALQTELSEVNPFKTKTTARRIMSGGMGTLGMGSLEDGWRHDTYNPVLMLEITAAGDSEFKSMTLRELLVYVNKHADMIDSRFESITSAERRGHKSSGNLHGMGLHGSDANTGAGSGSGLGSGLGSGIGGGGGSNGGHTGAGAGAGAGTGAGAGERTESPGSTGSARAPVINAVNLLRLRDLRRLETSGGGSGMHGMGGHGGPGGGGDGGAHGCVVLIRRHAVLFSLDPLKAIVMADRLILVIPSGADSILKVVEQYMTSWKNPSPSTSQSPTHTHAHTPKEKEDEGTSGSGNGAAAEGVRGGVGAHEGGEGGEGGGGGGEGGMGSGMGVGVGMGVRVEAVRGVGVGGGVEAREAPTVPFETHAYDGLFTMTMSIQSADFANIDGEVQTILRLFNQKGCILPIAEQEKMRTLKNTVIQMSAWLSNLRQAVEALIDDDETMALMNLTLLRDNPLLYRFPLHRDIMGTHEEVEELLESYLMDYESLQAKVEYLRTLMQSAEEFVSLRLDTARNELLVANTMFSVLACAIGFGSYLTGVFGMNLDNTSTIAMVHGSFTLVSALTFAAIVLIFLCVVGTLMMAGVLPTWAGKG